MSGLLKVSERLSFFYVERGALTVIDGALVLTDGTTHVRYAIPARTTLTIMVGPGSSVTTEAIRLAAAYGVLITWVGEHGVRTYSAGRAWGENTEWLEKQVRLYTNPEGTLATVQRMFEKRFGSPVGGRSVEQLRGIEGGRVKEAYKRTAEQFGVVWKGRRYTPGNPDGDTDAANLAINVANTCMYGLCETAILACGTHSGLGFLHRGSQQSFVLDIADLYKMEISVPLAMEVVSKNGGGAPWATLEGDVRRACRDKFRQTRIVEKIVPNIQEILNDNDQH